MNKAFSRHSCISLAIAVALGLTTQAAIAATAAASIDFSHAATASLRSGGVEIEPLLRAPAYQLRVVGPDGRSNDKSYLATETMLILPKTLGYPHWQDGIYHYELSPILGDRVRSSRSDAHNPVAGSAQNMVSSGTFRVLGGQIYAKGQVRESAASAARSVSSANRGNARPSVVAGGVHPQDVVNADDFIVQGSLCAGLDCVNNESFGFDTIRLKENNTRLAFDDTSTATGFSANDWAIVANDSASGGANFLGFQDVTGSKFPFMVTAGAPTNSLFVSSTGNLGVGTSTPILDVHMSTGDTPGVRFEQNASSGFSAQTWDVAGNEANFFVRDITGGSRLPFRIRPGAPTSSIDISASGDVGIGTASPTSRMHIVDNAGSISPGDQLRIENNGAARFSMKDTVSGSEWSFSATVLSNSSKVLKLNQRGAATGATTAMTVFENGNVYIGGTLTQLSDRNAKENFQQIDRQQLLQAIHDLPITRWNFKTENAAITHIGPMAQDFRAKFGLGENDTSIAPLDTSGVTLAAIQGLQDELAERDQRIQALENRLEALANTVQKLASAQAGAGADTTAMQQAGNREAAGSGLQH